MNLNKILLLIYDLWTFLWIGCITYFITFNQIKRFPLYKSPKIDLNKGCRKLKSFFTCQNVRHHLGQYQRYNNDGIIWFVVALNWFLFYCNLKCSFQDRKDLRLKRQLFKLSLNPNFLRWVVSYCDMSRYKFHASFQTSFKILDRIDRHTDRKIIKHMQGLSLKNALFR